MKDLTQNDQRRMLRFERNIVALVSDLLLKLPKRGDLVLKVFKGTISTAKVFLLLTERRIFM